MESLKEIFDVETLDVGTRTLAGFLIDGKIYLCREHMQAVRQFNWERQRAKLENVDLMKLKHATLHIILDKGKRTIFIDRVPLFTNMPNEEVVKQILKQYKKPCDIYEYNYKRGIELLYQS